MQLAQDYTGWLYSLSSVTNTETVVEYGLGRSGWGDEKYKLCLSEHGPLKDQSSFKSQVYINMNFINSRSSLHRNRGGGGER